MLKVQKRCKQNNIDFIDIMNYGDEGQKLYHVLKKLKQI